MYGHSKALYSNCSNFMYTFGAVIYVIALIRNANFTKDNTKASVPQINYRKTVSVTEYNSTGVILFMKYFQTSLNYILVTFLASNIITPY